MENPTTQINLSFAAHKVQFSWISSGKICGKIILIETKFPSLIKLNYVKLSHFLTPNTFREFCRVLISMAEATLRESEMYSLNSSELIAGIKN